MTPSYSSAGVLIRADPDGYGVSNGVHDVVALAGGGLVGTRVGLGDGFRGRRWWLAGNRRMERGVPGESGDAVRRVRDGGGWVRKRIRGGSVTARLFCEGHIGLDEFGSGQAEVGRLMGVSHAKTNESKVASQRNRWVEEAGRKKFGMRKLGRWWTERKRGEERGQPR